MKPNADRRSALVVISHYNAWPTDHLVHLLDQVGKVPAGHPFEVRVVVNRAEPTPLELPERHASVEVLYRENTGYNIGAWDHGWRQGPRHADYLFLQEECVIQRPGWLKAFLDALSRPGVGLVGESLKHPNATWGEVGADPNSPWNRVDLAPGEERVPNWAVETRGYLESIGVEPGPTIGHLQSLVLAASRETLEAIGGFRVGLTKEEAIACEVAISKTVEAAGKTVVQVALRPFEYILHPQWEYQRRESAGLKWWLRAMARRHLKGPLRRLARRRVSAAVNRA